ACRCVFATAQLFDEGIVSTAPAKCGCASFCAFFGKDFEYRSGVVVESANEIWVERITYLQVVNRLNDTQEVVFTFFIQVIDDLRSFDANGLAALFFAVQ